MLKRCKITVEDIPMMKVLYMRRTGDYGIENKLLMEKFKAWLKEHNIFHEESVILGIALDDEQQVKPELCRYDVCLIVPMTYNIIHEDVMSRTIEGGKYAVLEIEHTEEAVKTALEVIFQLLEQGFQLDFSRAIIERYAKKMIDRGLCEICVPVC